MDKRMNTDARRTKIILYVEKAEPKSIPKEKEEERTRVENMKSKISNRIKINVKPCTR